MTRSTNPFASRGASPSRPSYAPAAGYSGKPSPPKYEILRPWRFACLVAMVLSGLAGALYFLLKKPTTSQQRLPLIKAVQGPIRMAPQPDKEISDTLHHRVYKHIEKGKMDDDQQLVEQLLPPVEAPLLIAEAPVEPLTSSSSPSPPSSPLLESTQELPQAAESQGGNATAAPDPSAAQPSLPFIPAPSEPVALPRKTQGHQEHSQGTSIDTLLSRGEKKSPAKGFTLQVGPFPNKTQALQMWQRIQGFRLSGASKEAGVVSSLPLGSPQPSKYILFIRGLPSLQEAQRLVAQLHQKKVSALVLMP